MHLRCRDQNKKAANSWRKRTRAAFPERSLWHFAWQRLESRYWLRPFLAWINLFVMPGFAVLSGYLSRQPLNSLRAARLLIYVALPYLQPPQLTPF